MNSGKNTDRELYRENTADPAGSYYENVVFVTASGAIGMNVGGRCIVQPIAEWHDAALAALGRPVVVPTGEPDPRESVADYIVRNVRLWHDEDESEACSCGEVWVGHPNPHALTCPQHVG